jgi:uncharacterized membrane protein YgdD (TMEM256/DUF423 family)
MIRAWLAVAAIVGFFSVAAGAVSAHLGAGERTSELLRSGALYGMVHAAALVAIAAVADHRDQRSFLLIGAGWGFAAGMLLFSFSLFALALTGMTWLGIVTPLGGACLLIGWAALGAYALSRR